MKLNPILKRTYDYYKVYYSSRKSMLLEMSKKVGEQKSTYKNVRPDGK